MKHRKQQVRRLASERPFQVAAASAAALVLAATGALFAGAGADDAPASAQAPVAVTELRDDTAASRGQARLAAPPTGATASAAPSAAATTAAPDPDLTRKPAPPKPPASKVLDYDYQAQTTYWNCGPAAVRNALSAAGIERSQDALAGPLGADEFGTDSAEDTTRVLNATVKGSPYRTRMIRGTATPAQMDQLQADVVRAITDKRGVVVNVAGSATDTAGGWHSFPGGHYIAVVGYKDEGRLVKIADSANAAVPSYWMTTIDLATWASTRGYSA